MNSAFNLGCFAGIRVLVTGHTGYKGSWLTRTLHHLGAQVIGLSLPPEVGSIYSRIDNDYIQKEEFFDICEFKRTQDFFRRTQPQLIYHLAAQSLVRRSYRYPVSTFLTNVMGTINVLQASLDTATVRGVLAATTDKVYRNDEKLSGYGEEDPLGGTDPYSASKSAAEMGIFAWQNLATRTGEKKFVSVRSGNVIGGGDHSEDRLLPDLIRGFKENRPVEIRNPESVRPWQHVLDPLLGYLTLGAAILNGKQIANAYNFGPSEKSKLTVAQMCDLACEFWPNTASWVYRPSLDHLHESKFLWLSSSRANEHLGWKNLLDAHESIRWSIEWEIESENQTPLRVLDAQILRYLNSQNPSQSKTLNLQ